MGKPGGVPAPRGGRRPGALPLTEKLFATATSWQRKNQFSPMEDPWIYQSHSRQDAGAPWSNWPRQTKLHAFLWTFCFIFIYLKISIFALLVLREGKHD